MTVLGIAAAAWVAQISSVDACSYFPTWTGFDGFPAAGAENVPVDVVPLYLNPLEGVPDFGTVTFTLQGADGVAVPLTVHKLQGNNTANWSELRPVSRLQPNTRYTLRAHAEHDPMRYAMPVVDSALEFTTGASASSPSSPEGEVGLQHYVFTDRMANGCGGGVSGTCLNLPNDTFFQVRYPPVADGFGDSTLLVRGPSSVGQLGEGGLVPCVELRRRGVDGGLGPVRTVCQDQGPLYVVGPVGIGQRIDCTAAGTTLNGFEIASQRMPVPREQWDEVRSKAMQTVPITPLGGRADAGFEAGVATVDAGLADATPEAAAPAEEPSDEQSDDAGCRLSSRGTRGDAWMLVGVVALWSRARRRRTTG